MPLLLGELLDAVEAGTVRRRGRDWTAPAEVWRTALEVVLARRDEGRLDLPLRDHAYLFEVVTGLADKVEAEAERAHEEALRRRPAAPAAETPRTHPYDGLLAEATRLGVWQDEDGRVRGPAALAEAVRAARANGDGDA